MSTGKQQTSSRTPDPDRRASQRRYLGVVLVAYWLMLFLATHTPLPDLPGEAPGADKLFHLLGYGGLGLLLALWVALKSPLRVPSLLLLWGVVIVYGAMDEWLQQFVNREMDFTDWVADVSGATVGIGIVWLLQHFRPLIQEEAAD